MEVADVVEYSYHDVKPFIYTRLFHNPEKCKSKETYYRDLMPKETDRLTTAYESWNGDGLYFHHTLIAGRIVVAFLVIMSVVFANVWSSRTDISMGYAVGQYVLAVIPVVVIFVSNRLSI